MTPITQHAKDHPYQPYHTIDDGTLHMANGTRIASIHNASLLWSPDLDTKTKLYRLSFVVAEGESSWELLANQMCHCLSVFSGDMDTGLEFCLFDVTCDEIPQNPGDCVEWQCWPSVENGLVGLIRSTFGVLAEYSS